jgi:hypothetical protein
VIFIIEIFPPLEPLLSQDQQSPLSALTLQSQESIILADILNCLMGVEGQYVTSRQAQVVVADTDNTDASADKKNQQKSEYIVCSFSFSLSSLTSCISFFLPFFLFLSFFLSFFNSFFLLSFSSFSCSFDRFSS